MSLQFIVGRAGAGKSYHLYKNLIQNSIKYQNKKSIAVVPEQYSMETQKEILQLHENHGSFNIEVTSFTRLAYSVFEEQGVSGYKVMDDLGKTMVLRKVLEDCKKDLVIYKSKSSMPGFAEKIKTVISELKQYNITEDILKKMAEGAVTRPALKHKLNDVQVINHAFNQYIDEKMITPEDVLQIFCKHIPKSKLIKNTYFSFDGYTGFTPVQYSVLELLIKYSAGVTVAITLPDDEKDFTDYNKYELFSLSKETILKLKELARNNNVEIKEDIVVGNNEVPFRIRNNKELCFLEENIFRNKKIDKYDKEPRSIEIHVNNNPMSEAEFVANQITQLVIKDGYRYNDIAVITGDMEGYYRYLEEKFEQYNIPSFIDHKKNISSNPFVDGIKAAIEIIEKDFSYESVFHMMKLGFMNIEKETVDIMENYVLQFGRRGFKSYSAKWERLYGGMEENSLNIVNAGREKVVETIRPLRDALKKKNSTVLDFTKAIYRFILDNNMQQQIDEYKRLFESKLMLSDAKEYEQLYSMIISLLDKVAGLMGDEIISIRDYKQILQTGFETIKVGIIPPTIDTVMVGDIERTRLKDTKKVIFFIGVNDGIIPKSGEGGGIITDSDREALEKKNYILAPTARENVFRQKIYLYSLLAKPVEKICLSYSKSSSDGSVRRKSYLISTITKLFPQIKEIDEDDNIIDVTQIMNKNAALGYIASNIREYRFSQNNKSFEQLSGILLKDKISKQKIQLMAEGAFYKSNRPILRKEVARMLYGTKDNIGITRIERFANCAYSQFLNNGLKLGERKKFEVAAFDIGNLYHDAINEYFKEIQKDEISWSDLQENESHKIIDKCVEKVVDNYDNDAINTTARNLFIRAQVKETAVKTVDVLVKHIKSGAFIPTEYELKVTHGRIDRVDTLKKDNDLYVKVIDYKSGNKKFSIEKSYFGLQMQLMVYLKDAIDYEKKLNPDCNVYPAGGLYFHVHDPYINKPDLNQVVADFRKNNPNSELDDSDIKLQAIRYIQYQEYRMTGLVNADENIIREMDYGNSKKSDILPVQFTGKGLSKRSMVMNTDDYKKFVDYISDKADEMSKQIVDGKIDINPVEGACDYCPYINICGFERKLGDRYRELEKLQLEDIVNIINSDNEGE